MTTEDGPLPHTRPKPYRSSIRVQRAPSHRRTPAPTAQASFGPLAHTPDTSPLTPSGSFVAVNAPPSQRRITSAPLTQTSRSEVAWTAKSSACVDVGGLVQRTPS